MVKEKTLTLDIVNPKLNFKQPNFVFEKLDLTDEKNIINKNK